MTLTARESIIGGWNLDSPYSYMKKYGTNTCIRNTIKHCFKANPCCNGEQHFVMFAQMV